MFSQDLLEQIVLHIPARNTRNNQLFEEVFHRCNYSKSSPLSEMVIYGNSIQFEIPISFYANFTNLCDLGTYPTNT